MDDLYQAGNRQILRNREVAELLEKSGSLKQAAALLEEEIEMIRTENASDPTPAPDEPGE